MPRIPFAGQSYTDRSLNANAQRSVNLYPMRSPVSGFRSQQDRIVMYPTPGYRAFVDLTQQGIPGAGAIRGMAEINGTLYVVSGTRLVKVTALGATVNYSAVGTLFTSTGRCSVVCNTVQLVISDGQSAYAYDLSTGAFAAVSSAGFPSGGGVTNLAFHDGYVLAAVNGTKKVIQSNLLDATAWGAQAFDSITSFPDDVTAVFSDDLQLYAFGPKLAEVQADVGTIPYAFQKVQGVLVQAGCAAWPTLAKVGGTVMWLASDAAGKAFVAAMTGYTPSVISTPPINEALERYTKDEVAAAFAFSYREGDSQFYCLTFPNATWVYDAKQNLWHERSVNGGRDLPDHYASWNGRHVVGDATGTLYDMSQDYSTDAAGNGLTRIRTCQHLGAENYSLFVHELEIDIESGVGLPSGQGSDPLATLELSKDNGNTWVNLGPASMGKIGEYRKRLVWRRLGRTRGPLTFRLTVTDPVKTYVIDAYAKMSQGAK